jgi:hypothetical protein
MACLTNARRNRLLFWVFSVIYALGFAAFAWIGVQLGDKKDRRGYALAAVCVAGLLWVAKALWDELRDHREAVQARDEDPIPLRFAASRESAIASILALVLIVLAIVTYWMGWWAEIGLR